MLSNRDTEEEAGFQDLGLPCLRCVDDELNKLQELLVNADIVKNKMIKLIQTVLQDETATADRYQEAIDDAKHVGIIIAQHPANEDEDEQ